MGFDFVGNEYLLEMNKLRKIKIRKSFFWIFAKSEGLIWHSEDMKFGIISTRWAKSKSFNEVEKHCSRFFSSRESSSSRSIFVRFPPLPPPPSPSLLFFFIQFLFSTSHVLNFLFLFPIPLVIHFLLRSHVSFLLSLRVPPFRYRFHPLQCLPHPLFFFHGFERILFSFFFFLSQIFTFSLCFYVCCIRTSARRKVCFLLISLEKERITRFIEINFSHSSYFQDSSL